MKKKLAFQTLPALLLVFGMALAACDNGTKSGSPGSGPVDDGWIADYGEYWIIEFQSNSSDYDYKTKLGTTATITLDDCGFTRAGCTFAGWAASPDGPIVHASGTSINTPALGDYLHLFAKWTVTNAAAVVADAKISPDYIRLIGVDWSNNIKSALETTLSGGSNMMLDLFGVGGITGWNDTTLSSNKNKISELSLPSTVTTLGVNAFAGYTSLASANWDGVTTIGNNAFKNCTSLQYVDLRGTTSIGNNAFEGCTGLQYIVLPASPPTLGSGVFKNTKGGTSTLIYIFVNTGVTAYETAWGVTGKNPISAETTDSTGKYGNNHNAITIQS